MLHNSNLVCKELNQYISPAFHEAHITLNNLELPGLRGCHRGKGQKQRLQDAHQ